MSAEFIERRKMPRPDAPRPALRMRLQIFADSLASRIFGSLASAVAFILVQMVCIALAVWSFGVRLPNAGAVQSLQQQLVQLQQQYQQLRQGWSQQQLEEAEQGLRTQQARVLPDFAALANWLRSRHRQARQYDLDMQYRIGASRQSGLDTVVVPVNFTLKPGRSAVDTSYTRVLAFVYALIDDKVQLAIDSSLIEGDGNDVRLARIAARIRVKDGDGMAVQAMHEYETNSVDSRDDIDFE